MRAALSSILNCFKSAIRNPHPAILPRHPPESSCAAATRAPQPLRATPRINTEVRPHARGTAIAPWAATLDVAVEIPTGEEKMLKKICSALLSALLLQAAAAPAFAKSDADKEAARAEKVRTQFANLGTGQDARVKIELRDKTKLEG